MYGCLIVCRSVTYAQRMARALEKRGFSANMVRLPAGLPGIGCGYGVKIPGSQIAQALVSVKELGFPASRVFCEFQNGQMEEYPV